jgi:hypothetical protein
MNGNTQTAMIALEEALKSTLTEVQLTCYSLLRKEWEKQINSREDMIRDLKSELRQTQNELADARW